MDMIIRRVAYFYTTVKDKPCGACHLLCRLKEKGVNLCAFHAIPFGADSTQLVLFPEDPQALTRAAGSVDLVLTGPQNAFIVQGKDEMGALGELHRKLCDGGVNVYSSYAVGDGAGRFGYILHVRPEEYETAARVLGL
ncbi:MAG: hypothetical protein JW958_04770 [Candidatus Eisenbacteria bacterium]|nr:hypothetical protein [Candidatus Eisenbacteria bacterium]